MGRKESIDSHNTKLNWGVVKLSFSKILTYGLSFLVLPILTRIYPPESFGALSLFVSVVSILTIIGTFNYDVAITSTKHTKDAVSVLVGALMCLIITATILSIVVLFVPERFYGNLGLERLYPYRWLIPFGMVLSSTQSCMNYYILRTQKFGLIAKVNLSQSVAQAGTQLTAGVLKMFSVGLILGDLANKLLSSLVFIWSEKSILFSQSNNRSLLRRSFRQMKKLRQFPAYGLPSDLIITLGVALPSIFISKVWDAKVLGFFLIAQKVSDVPLLLLGTPIGRVFMSEAMRINKEEPVKLLEHFKSTSKKLFLISFTAIPVAVVSFYFVAGPLLGEKFASAGTVALLMIPFAIARFFTSPISQISAVIKKQDVEFYVSLFRFLLVLGLFYLFYLQNFSFNKALLIYSLASFGMYGAFYSVYLFLVYQHHRQYLGSGGKYGS